MKHEHTRFCECLLHKTGLKELLEVPLIKDHNVSQEVVQLYRLTLFLNTVKIVTVSSTRTWTPPVAPGSAPVSHASSSPSSPASEDQLPSPHAYTSTTFEHCSSNADSAGLTQYHESEQCSSGSDAVPSISPQSSIGCGPSERAGVVFDNSTLQKW